MLWAGLLCAAGERAQCDAIRASQTTDGRLWRSPSRVNVQTQNSSSRDMLLGFLHYPDSSDASLQRAFMAISGLYLMKALYTQGVRVPISSTASTSTRMAIGP